MRRGTTPELTFTLSEDLSFDSFYITFQQGGVTVFELTEADATVEGQNIVVTLTQAQTLALNADKTVHIQIRGKSGSDAYASEIKQMSVGAILKEGAI